MTAAAMHRPHSPWAPLLNVTGLLVLWLALCALRLLHALRWPVLTAALLLAGCGGGTSDDCEHGRQHTHPPDCTNHPEHCA